MNNFTKFSYLRQIHKQKYQSQNFVVGQSNMRQLLSLQHNRDLVQILKYKVI